MCIITQTLYITFVAEFTAVFVFDYVMIMINMIVVKENVSL